jgi:hypothetical protein
VQAAATASASAHVFLAVLGVYVIHTNIFFYYRYAQFTHSADKRLLYLYRHWELMGVGLITDLTLLAGQVQVQR